MIDRWRSLSRRARLAAIGLLALAIGGVALVAPGRSDGDWVKAVRADLPLSVEVTGTLKAVESDLLGPPPVAEMWEFKIAFLAPEGAKVKQGQPVLGFDASALQRDLETKVAERDTAAKEIEKKESELALAEHDGALAVAEAEAKLRKATLLVSRPDELVASKELAKAKLDHELAEREVAYIRQKIAMKRRAAASELAALRSTQERAAGRVGEIDDAIARMTVKAGRGGTLIYISDWRGDKRKVGDTVWREDKVVEVPDLRAMSGKGEVDEADAGKIAAGQSVHFRLDAHPDLEYLGKVSAVARAVERKSRQNPLKIVRLDVALERTDEERMRPGMRFRGTAETGRLRGVVIVPLDAVFPTPAGPVVYRRTLAGVSTTPVRTGARSEQMVEIVAGLSAGDTVSRRDLGPSAGAR